MWGALVYIGIFLSPPDPPPDGDKVTTRDAHCGLHNEHLKNLGPDLLTRQRQDWLLDCLEKKGGRGADLLSPPLIDIDTCVTLSNAEQILVQRGGICPLCKWG